MIFAKIHGFAEALKNAFRAAACVCTPNKDQNLQSHYNLYQLLQKLPHDSKLLMLQGDVKPSTAS